MDFEASVELLLSDRVEGGYANDRRDPGGETMWGITRRTAIRHGYQGDMHLLPKAKAREIYKKEYWDPIKVDHFPPCFRYALFDGSVNSGPGQSVKWLQRALDLGETGKVTDEELVAAKNLVDPLATAMVMISHRLDFLTDLPTWGHHGRGWARRIALVMQTTAASAAA